MSAIAAEGSPAADIDRSWLAKVMIACGDSSVFQPRGHPELRTIVGAIGPDPRSRHVPAGVDRRTARSVPSVDSESDVMPDLRAVVIQQARAMVHNWNSGVEGPIGWPATALTAADRAALDVRARRGGFALRSLQ